jgi:hypothetical protein
MNPLKGRHMDHSPICRHDHNHRTEQHDAANKSAHEQRRQRYLVTTSSSSPVSSLTLMIPTKTQPDQQAWGANRAPALARPATRPWNTTRTPASAKPHARKGFNVARPPTASDTAAGNARSAQIRQVLHLIADRLSVPPRARPVTSRLGRVRGDAARARSAKGASAATVTPARPARAAPAFPSAGQAHNAYQSKAAPHAADPMRSVEAQADSPWGAVVVQTRSALSTASLVAR